MKWNYEPGEHYMRGNRNKRTPKHRKSEELKKGSKEYRVFVFKSCGTSAFSQRFLRVTHEKGLVAIHSCDSIDQNNP